MFLCCVVLCCVVLYYLIVVCLTGSVYSSGSGSTPTTPRSGLTLDQAWNEMHNTPSQRIRQALTPTYPLKGQGGVVASIYQRILSSFSRGSSGMQPTSLPSPFSSLSATKPSLSIFSSNASVMNDIAVHPASPGTSAKSWMARLNGGFSFPSSHR